MKKTNVTWLIVIVLTLALVLSGCGDESEAPPTSTPLVLPTAVPAVTPEPTEDMVTEDVTPDPTLEGEPTAAPEPAEEEWTTQVDPDTGEEYLSPPPEVEAQIREAFASVLATSAIEDVPDEEALKYDREAALERLAQFASPEIVEWRRTHLMPPYDDEAGYPGITLTEFEPETPVRCKDYDTCTLKRVAKPSSNVVQFGVEFCTTEYTDVIADDGDHCVIRYDGDWVPLVTYIATIEKENGDGVWLVTGYHEEWESN